MVVSEPGAQPAVAHVVWDWNGTLFDDADALIQSTIEAFEATGSPPITVDQYRRQHTQPIDVFYDRLFGAPVPPDLRSALHAAFHEAYSRRRPSLALAVDAREALGAITTRGLSQSLLSMHPHDRLTSLVDRFGIAAHFARIDGQRGPDRGFKRAHLAEHLELLGLASGDVLLIGDSVDDAAAAEAVGARCVLYASGLHATEVLAEQGVPVVTSLRAAIEFAGGEVR
ncbi:HAD hydrolase-like protein [Saccharopolyspora sp. WRP15-2]|uniref:HAD hydrolase-like protein n=1 Tax=Saccharopolyspora oryzae TaxID=2997343 RepID=A0ABT4V924_9PSEU|nr:HAD hydrolase-like protein [Saccharopolyspora oryzae]MDA3630456.1 HAD hydrolase-like protein [Saccharopolyspora oryzae]